MKLISQPIIIFRNDLSLNTLDNDNEFYMNQNEFNLYFHEVLFKNHCHEKQGMAFQIFFEDIMEKKDKSFIRVKPSGRAGDWKCDGYSQISYTVYQCYAPEKLTSKKASNKILDDFEGAKIWWGDKMKEWIFLYSNINKLPAEVINVIQVIKENNIKIAINTWNRENLWDLVKTLPEAQRNILLGIAPKLDDAPDITSAEVEVLMNFLVEENHTQPGDEMDLTDLVEKIRINHLQNEILPVIKNSIGISKIVEIYIKKHPDTRYSEKVAGTLIQKYKELKEAYKEDSEKIYWDLIQYTGGNKSPKMFWAAAGIVTYYFQLCDIFEK